MRWLLTASAAIVAVLIMVGSGSQPAQAREYRVRSGDTLWALAQRSGTSVERLSRENGIRDPSLIVVGSVIKVPEAGQPAAALPQPQPPAASAPPSLSREQAKTILVQAARRHGLRPSFVLALSYWESGWNQASVSSAGAIGLMQVMPSTASWAGPSLLGRKVDLNNPADNADVGAALLRQHLDQFNDPKLALAAYYQGAAGTKKYGIYPGSHTYVDGIWGLRNHFEATSVGI